MSVDESEVLEYIESNRDEMVEFLDDLIRAKSLPGQEKPAQEVVIDRLRGYGLEPDVWEPDAEALRDHPGWFETTPYEEYGYEDRPNVAATVEGSGGGRSLVLSGHVDVVTPEPLEAWSYDPWEATVEGDRLYGRGSNDMKGGIAAFLHAYDALYNLDVDLAGDLTLQTTIEEEAGGTGGVLSALERGYQPDAAVICEPSGVPTLGRASAGVMYFRVTVHGKAAHTAYKFRGVDAVGKAAKIYHALEELDRERKARIPDYPPAVNQAPDASGNMTNLSISTFEAGDWTSMVPGKAVMQYRVGWTPNADQDKEEVREEILGAIERVVQDDEWLSEHPPEVEWFGWNTNPHELDVDREFVGVVEDNTELVTGEEVGYRGGLGGQDERFYVNFYDIPCPSVGPVGGNAHGADEWVDVDSLVDVAKVLALTAMDWCKTGD